MKKARGASPKTEPSTKSRVAQALYLVATTVEARATSPETAALHLRRAASLIEDNMEFVRAQVAHYDELISRGKGTHGSPDYVRDDVWNGWSGRLFEGRRILSEMQENEDRLAQQESTHE